jgi:hypothetical protein
MEDERSGTGTEADRPIWQDTTGAIAKVRRRRPRGGAAWPRGRREAAAGGWTTGEAAAYSGRTAGEAPRAGGWRPARLREREDGGGRETGNGEAAAYSCWTDWKGEPARVIPDPSFLLMNFDRFDKILLNFNQILSIEF